MKVLILGSGGLVGSSLKKILDKNESIKKVICSTREDTNLFDFEETKRLIKIKEKNNIDLPALNSIGYEQIRNFLHGEMSKEALLETIINKTWQYARKQVKWFRNEDIDLTIDITNLDSVSTANCIYDLYSTIK